MLQYALVFTERIPLVCFNLYPISTDFCSCYKEIPIKFFSQLKKHEQSTRLWIPSDFLTGHPEALNNLQWNPESTLLFSHHLSQANLIKRNSQHRKRRRRKLWSDCWPIKCRETLWHTYSKRKKSCLTLSEKTFEPLTMELYMFLFALYKSDHVNTHRHTHGDSGKNEQGLYRVLMCCASLIKVLRTP